MTTMDFFGHQAKARKASKWLVLLFLAAVGGIIALLYLVAVIVFAATDLDSEPWNPGILLAIAGGVIVTVTLAMLYKTSQLRGGGGKVARMLGGSRVDPGTTDPQQRQLHNVVEEMAIASGIPVPEVYILREEAGMNAFAAGWGTKDAAIAVTQGLLEKLDRDELQGVIAHEFSHVFHGDMRLNIRLMGVLFGIVCIATIGRIVTHATARGGSRKNGGGIVLFGIAMMIIGWLGVLFARMIQAAVSRQREFLADSSAVQYTRNPRGIGMALAKIGGLGIVKNAHADEASHMMFANAVSGFLSGAFATHPPVTARVERILPGFQTEWQKLGGAMPEAVAAIAPPAGTSGFAGGGVGAAEFVGSIGDPQPQHVQAARDLLAQLPLDLVAAAHEPARAGAVALGLLLETEPAARDRQLQAIGEADAAALQAARLLAPDLARLPHESRLPLLEITIPALRMLPREERRALRRRARQLAEADAVITPFEFALLKTIERHVPEQSEFTHARAPRPTALVQHGQDAAVVVSALAWAGKDGDLESARQAFDKGWAALESGSSGELLAASACGIAALEPSLDALATVSSLGRRNLLAACAEAAGADGVIAPDELDLLRALAELWECPVPLLKPGPG